MNDIRILENLFDNNHDQITFRNLKESNIIYTNNNNNKEKYLDNRLQFATLSIS